MKLKEIQDPWTKNWFPPKRRDQVYESRQSQIDHGNFKAWEDRQKKKAVEHFLRREFKILNNIMQQGKISNIEVDEEDLIKDGMTFSYSNGVFIKEKEQYILVYCYAYQLNTKTKKVKIIKA